MQKGVKWGLIIFGGIVALFVLILLILPLFFDAKQYKPILENKVAEMTGRRFSVGGDVSLSFFPFAGVSFSDLHLGNPSGFAEKDFLSIKSFDVRVKLLPLLYRDIQVKRFVLNEPQIVMVKNKNGSVNWAFPAQKGEKGAKEPAPKAAEGQAEQTLPIRSLSVGEFSVKNGSVLWVDHATDTRQKVDQLNLVLKDLSLDRPVGLQLSARLDDKPVSLDGTVGPIGQDPGKATIPLDVSLKALSEMSLKLKGTVVSPAADPRADLKIDIAEFSPRKLLAALGKDQLVATADPNTLGKMALQADIAAGTNQVSLSKGTMTLDDSKLNFTARVAEFSRPNVTFDVDLDKIDLDRYMPPKSETKAESTTAKAPAGGGQSKPDYGPLRRLILDGKLKAGEVIVNKARLGNLLMNVRAKNGVIQIAPLQIDLYQGNMTLNSDVNVTQSVPRSQIKLQLKNVQAGPLMKDQLDKDFLEGLANADINLSMSGDDPAVIKKTLNGSGEVRFNDGAIKGVDLVGIIRSARAALSGQSQAAEVGTRTDFTELVAPFSITNGVVNTSDTRMQSPLIRVQAAGKANLVSESLDFRIEPKLVGTLKGQGDQQDRSGVMVPVVVSGTFAAPKFAPDLEAVAKQQLQEKVLESDKVKKLFENEKLKPFEDTAKGVLKKFLN